ncbi:MAG: hypothetical protein UV05_C0022G0001 [candidate division CPR1 bacterium GW2011_GWA2_42_17]|uniref:Glucose/sorbosone dehydrogenase n=1 Tax=candidate division CPR1 bacterium GW2011_GWA2_42_17 TaxID=1618341 RepID=A0A0G1C270_9BACT|nr:MAG: hypothetical protein UV05_C0022G0001 [candidate division CPR1 bacterium GW2011_GWA2_42_17]
MISWSTRRQTFYISIAVIVFIFAIALPVFFVTYKPPSCSDRIKNQGEGGVDCGGPCALLCKADALDLIVHWQRAFKVKDGVYNALAYVENPNQDSGIDSISYLFKLYDKDNLLIYERRGQTFAPAKKIFGIFESNIMTGNRIPARTFFEFSQTPAWKKESVSETSLATVNKLFLNEGGLPRLTALLENRGIGPIYNIEVVAIVYDETDNAVASSRTVVDSLGKTASAPLIFTWPEPFSAPATRVELLYRVLR